MFRMMCLSQDIELRTEVMVSELVVRYVMMGT